MAQQTTFRITAQQQVFGLTWLAYASFYLCRKNIGVLMPAFEGDLHMAKHALANMLFAYGVAYAGGQFLAGPLADRWGPRRVVVAGMVVSAAATAAMAGFEGMGAFIVCQAINGLAQACGWPGLLRVMTHWFTAARRGQVMAWWSTNYVLGGFLATNLAAWTLGPPVAVMLGYRAALWIPAALLLVSAAVVFGLLKDHPGDEAEVAAQRASRSLTPLKEVSRIREIQILAAIYFILKMTRYAFLFWLPVYLVERLHYGRVEAGHTSSIYELAGFVGTLAAGYASDKVFGGRRRPVSTMMLAGLAAAFVLPPMAASWGPWAVGASIGLIGALTFGPDTLIGGAATQDAVPAALSGSAGGFVNGVGSLGQLLSPYVVSETVERWGWDALFRGFVILALLGAVLSGWPSGRGRKELPGV